MTLTIAVWTTGRPVPEAERARGSFFRMFESALEGDREAEIRLVDFDATQEGQWYAAEGVDAVIVSGSPARLGNQEPWMLRIEGALRSVYERGLPLLGVCFGHQLMGEAFGGKVAPNPAGREIGTVSLELLGSDPLLGTVGGAGPTIAMSHLDSVVELPTQAERLARSGLEKNAAFRIGARAWGVQFHPEMDAEIVGHYIQNRAEEIRAEGQEPESLLRNLKDSPYGRELLGRFVRIVGESRG